MKKLTMILMGGLVLAFFANCGKKDEDRKGSADMSAACYAASQSNQVYMNGACMYNYQAASSGVFTNYSSAQSGYTMTGAGSTIGCNAQQSLAYSATKGLGCVYNAQLSMSGQPAYYALNQMTNSFLTISAPNAFNPYSGYGQTNQMNQYGGMQNYSGLQGYGMNGQTVLRVCDDTEKCPDTQSCRPPVMNSPSRLGICYHN